MSPLDSGRSQGQRPHRGEFLQLRSPPSHPSRTQAQSHRLNGSEQPDAPRSKFLTPGSVVPELAHLNHENHSAWSSSTESSTCKGASNQSLSGMNNLQTRYGSGKVAVSTPSGNSKVNVPDGHPREQMRNGTPYPSKDRPLKSAIENWSPLGGARDDDLASSVEGFERVLKDVRLNDNKPRLVTISKASKLSQGGQHENPDRSEILTRFSTPIVPGAWPATPPPLGVNFKDAEDPSPQTSPKESDSALAALPNERMKERLRGLAISSLIDDHRKSTKCCIFTSSREAPEASGAYGSSSNDNRVSVDTYFSQKPSVSYPDMPSSAQGHPELPPKYKLNESNEHLSREAEGDSASSMNMENTDDLTHDQAEVWHSLFNKYLRDNPQTSTAMSAKTSSSVLPAHDVPTLTTATDTPSLASLPTTNTREPKHSPRHDSITQRRSPSVELLHISPSLPLHSPIPVRAAFNPRQRPIPSISTVNHARNYLSTPASYTCSTHASGSILATSNPPSPGIGVYNSKEAVLRTAGGRMYYLPDKRPPVDLTDRYQKMRRMENMANQEMNQFAHACEEMSKYLAEGDEEVEDPRQDPHKRFQHDEAHEEIRRQFAQRVREARFSRGKEAQPSTTSSAPRKSDPSSPVQPSRDTKLYAAIPSPTPSPNPPPRTQTIAASPISDPDFGYPLHSFSDAYDPQNPHNLLRPLDSSPSQSYDSSSDWIDIDSTSSLHSLVAVRETRDVDSRTQLSAQLRALYNTFCATLCHRVVSLKKSGGKKEGSGQRLRESRADVIRRKHAAALHFLDIAGPHSPATQHRKQSMWKRCVRFPARFFEKRKVDGGASGGARRKERKLRVRDGGEKAREKLRMLARRFRVLVAKLGRIGGRGKEGMLESNEVVREGQESMQPVMIERLGGIEGRGEEEMTESNEVVREGQESMQPVMAERLVYATMW